MKKNKRRPVLWRHHYSGVWIGWISESDVPGHLRLEGTRIRRWAGRPVRVDCSSLAALGVAGGDTLTEWTTTDIAIEGSVEIHDTTDAHVERAREFLERNRA